MESNCLHRNVEYIKGVIATLVAENQSIVLQIDRLEVDIENVLSIEAKINTGLSTCASGTVGLFIDKDVLGIAEDARAIATRLKLEINMLEEAIKSNNQQIARYQESIQLIESEKLLELHT